MKKSKILVPALGILVLSTAASITGTVAWFSANNNTTVDGMEVKTKVAGNMLIAAENAEANYGSALTQSRVGTLEPASTINGVNYFYTVDAKADGSKEKQTSEDPYVAYSEAAAISHAAAGKTAFDAAFVETYTGVAQADVTTDNVVYGYIDYSFYLKATNTASSAYQIRMTKCNLLYDDAPIGANDLSWRVAVFAKDSAQATPTTDEVAAGNLKSILTPSGAAYWDSTAVTSTTAKASVTNLNTAATIVSSVGAGATIYEKVTVRLWLEGEDTKCNNQTYASLTSKSWKLDLDFSFVDSTDATKTSVTNIGSVAA